MQHCILHADEELFDESKAGPVLNPGLILAHLDSCPTVKHHCPSNMDFACDDVHLGFISNAFDPTINLPGLGTNR